MYLVVKLNFMKNFIFCNFLFYGLFFIVALTVWPCRLFQISITLETMSKFSPQKEIWQKNNSLFAFFAFCGKSKFAMIELLNSKKKVHQCNCSFFCKVDGGMKKAQNSLVRMLKAWKLQTFTLTQCWQKFLKSAWK